MTINVDSKLNMKNYNLHHLNSLEVKSQILKFCCNFLDECKLNETIYKNLAFAILYSQDLMQIGWFVELCTHVK